MALQINFATKYGVEGNYVNFDPQIANKTRLNLKMKFWKDKNTRDTEGMLPYNEQMAGGSNERITGFECNYSFDYDLTSPLNPFQQGYEFLKTLPEFSEATDDTTEEQTTQLDVIKTAAESLKTQFNNISKPIL